jgi:hypothetical protein
MRRRQDEQREPEACAAVRTVIDNDTPYAGQDSE